jgi:hypothetical protein
MVEIDGLDALLTWKIAKRDIDLLFKGDLVKAEKLPDHRKAYLAYEGPVNMGMGIVKIFDSGDCRTLLKEDNKLVFELEGKILAGNIRLYCVDNILFTIQYIPKQK